MDKVDVIRAAVKVGGLEIFNLVPQYLDKPLDHLDDLRVVANSFSRMDCSDLHINQKLCCQICEKFALILEGPKLPSGCAALAAIIEYLSACLKDNTLTRALWLKLAKNRKHFIRRRFTRLLRGDLTQREADDLWNVYCEKGDSEILRNLILADSSILLHGEVIDGIAAEEGQGYLLSRAIAHAIKASGIEDFERFRQRFPVSTIYAGGFSGRADLVPLLHLIVNSEQVSEDERKGAIWALARLKDKSGVFSIAAARLK